MPIGDTGREAVGEFCAVFKSITEFAADMIGDEGLVEAALDGDGRGDLKPVMIERFPDDALLIEFIKPVRDLFCELLLIEVEYNSSRPAMNVSVNGLHANTLTARKLPTFDPLSDWKSLDYRIRAHHRSRFIVRCQSGIYCRSKLLEKMLRSHGLDSKPERTLC